MATIKLTISVEKLSNVMTIFDRIKVYRSATESGTYAEITDASTRIVLLSTQSVYTYDDVAGDISYYYKTSYYHSSTFLESSLSDALQGDDDLYYIDIQDIRDEGVVVSRASDFKILSLIRMWQRFLERSTGNWFRSRTMSLELDGNGTTLLQLPFPIISVTELYINDDLVNALESTAYKAYTGRGNGERDDRKNPRIKLVTNEVSIFTGTGSMRSYTTVFEVGEKNILLNGAFGYTESDGSTPEPIKYALKKLVIRGCAPMAGGVFNPAGPVVEEETDRHRRRYSDSFITSKAWSITGDIEVDQIISMYRKPLKIGAPRTMNRRLTGGRIT